MLPLNCPALSESYSTLVLLCPKERDREGGEREKKRLREKEKDKDKEKERERKSVGDYISKLPGPK